jgi:hypothetical protein
VYMIDVESQLGGCHPLSYQIFIVEISGVAFHSNICFEACISSH